MSYTYSYNNLVIDNLPKNKQTTNHIKWLNIIVKPVQRLNDILNYFNTGSTFSSYTASATYSIGSRVNGGLTYNNAVYEANKITAGTFSNTDWDLIIPSFIGYQERLKYVDSRIVFEWALNKYFGTTFSQPNYTDTSKSIIYIQDYAISQIVFEIGLDTSSSFAGLYDSTIGGPGTSQVWVGLDPSIYPAAGNAFSIYVPYWLYITLPGYTGATQSADLIVRNFANKINYSSIPFDIKIY